MNDYEELLDLCFKEHVSVIEKKFKSNAKGFWKDNKIAISKDLNTISEKLCILAEELGHYKTSSGNILDINNINNCKQELKARNTAFESLCSIDKIIDSVKNGARNRYELAESLHVTDQFLSDAMEYYKSKYGLSFKYKNMIIRLEPVFSFTTCD